MSEPKEQQKKQLKHRLDRPKLREKIEDIVEEWLYGAKITRSLVNLILALFPGEEEIRKQEGKRMLSVIESKFTKVSGGLVKPYRFIDEDDWQVLKAQEEG